MVTVARIRANDEPTGRIIRLGYERAEYDGVKGWRVAASNGDDVGNYEPQSKDKCCSDIGAMWGTLATFEWV